MSEPTENTQRVVVIGPNGMPMQPTPETEPDAEQGDEDGATRLTELVEQPAMVMRIGSMVKQLLEEVRAAPLDEASRRRLREIHRASISELEKGLAPELSRRAGKVVVAVHR